MKKLDEVKKQIADNIRVAAQRNISEREYKKISKETEQLRTIAKYLETNPSEEYLISTKAKFEKIIKSKNEQFNYWFHHARPIEVDDKKARSFFNKENGLTHLRRQIKTLNLILQ